MVKIVFSDFDDTLMHYYSNKNYFDSYQLGILKKLKDKEIKFCIVTGRSVSFFYQFPELLQYVDYILASNGAVIYDVENKKFIYSILISSDSLEKLVQYAKGEKISFILNSFEKRYQYGDWSNAICDSYQENVKYSCEQFLLSVNRGSLDQCCQFLSNLRDICVNNISNWEDYFTLDVNNILVSKGNSMKWLSQYLGISLGNVLAFGDGENDISMFEVAGKSVAVGNASDRIQQIANDVTLKCEENGVFRYLEDKILK